MVFLSGQGGRARLRAPKFICANMNQVSTNITHDIACFLSRLISAALCACFSVEPRAPACCVVEHTHTHPHTHTHSLVKKQASTHTAHAYTAQTCTHMHIHMHMHTAYIDMYTHMHMPLHVHVHSPKGRPIQTHKNIVWVVGWRSYHPYHCTPKFKCHQNLVIAS